MGKFLQTDPKADKYGSWTPYNYGFNDPVYWNDPNGDDGNATTPGGDNKRWINQSRQEDQDASNGMYGASSNYETYGSSEGAGGGYFTRYGPGDGGALRGFSAYVVSNSHAAKARKKGGVAGTNSKGQRGYFVKSFSVIHNGEGDILDELAYSETFVPAGMSQQEEYSVLQANAGDLSDLSLKALVTFMGITQMATDIGVNGPRPKYTGAGDWNRMKVSGSKFSTRLGVAGIAITALDGAVNGWKPHHTADVIIGVALTAVPFLLATPGVNIAVAVIGGAYFLADFAWQRYSGESLTETWFDK